MPNPAPPESAHDTSRPSCVMVFNANDPSGAGSISSDIMAMSSVGAHALPVITGTYVRDTTEILDHAAVNEEIVAEQARTVLEDVHVQVIKVGFAGTPENLSAIAETVSDYPDLPVIAYMPDLSWWSEVQIDLYLDAFRELILPQATVLIGNHSTLWRWLLPDWGSEKPPSARDIARVAAESGVPYTLVTGIPAPEQFIDNVLSSPQAVLGSVKFERFDAVFTGVGDTLSATLSALLANGYDLPLAFTEALNYLDRCLDGGFRPGMGNVIPDRLFWAQLDADDAAPDNEPPPTDPSFEMPPHDTQH